MARTRPRAPSSLAVPLALIAVGLALAAPGTATASVLVVGDSLALGTEPSLRAALPGVTLEADSRNGRPSGEGVGVLQAQLRPEHEVVVFDLGTNDGPAAAGATAASFAAARSLAGDRCLVVATLNHPEVAGVPVDLQNEAIRDFAATNPGVAVVEWSDAALADPGLLRPDGVHATPAGYGMRGSLFAEAVLDCLTGGVGAPAAPPHAAQASSTDRPARRRRPKPSGPSLERRLADALVERMTGPAAPLGIAGDLGGAVMAAAESVGAALTPSGPEPVLGAK